MRFAFVLFKYFPFGGLQRDMVSMAKVGLERGHEITAICSDWQGDWPEGLAVCCLPVKGISNDSKMRAFARAAAGQLQQMSFDLIVGFNKLPQLDVYYAADSCFAAKVWAERSWLYRLTPRARTYLRLESAVFSRHSQAQVLELSTVERLSYQRYYKTPDGRFHTLPPGIWKEHRRGKDQQDLPELMALRASLGIHEDSRVLLAVGSGFRTKGVDRSIRLLADWQRKNQGDAVLLIAGQESSRAFEKLARDLGVAEQVHFLGGRDDVPALLRIAEVLLHPARKENTGNVLLEAMVAGRPVITTDVCGYSHYVETAQMGKVLPSPFSQQHYLSALEEILGQQNAEWHQRGIEFARRDDLYARSDRALDFLEGLVQSQAGQGSP